MFVTVICSNSIMKTIDQGKQLEKEKRTHQALCDPRFSSYLLYNQWFIFTTHAVG